MSEKMKEILAWIRTGILIFGIVYAAGMVVGDVRSNTRAINNLTMALNVWSERTIALETRASILETQYASLERENNKDHGRIIELLNEVRADVKEIYTGHPIP